MPVKIVKYLYIYLESNKCCSQYNFGILLSVLPTNVLSATGQVPYCYIDKSLPHNILVYNVYDTRHFMSIAAVKISDIIWALGVPSYLEMALFNLEPVWLVLFL